MQKIQRSYLRYQKDTFIDMSIVNESVFFVFERNFQGNGI